jgi:hypothetical protein
MTFAPVSFIIFGFQGRKRKRKKRVIAAVDLFRQLIRPLQGEEEWTLRMAGAARQDDQTSRRRRRRRRKKTAPLLSLCL